MKNSLLLVLSVAIESVAGQPFKPLESAKCTQYVDNFDSLDASIVAPSLFPLGTVNGTRYSQWVVSQSEPLSGVAAHSGSKGAGASLTADVISGRITTNTFGSLIADSGSFDFESFWFGCFLSGQQKVASAATGCTIAITGFNLKDEQVPEATFAFAPRVAEGAQTVLAMLPSSYTKLKNVTLGLSAASVNPALTVLFIDDVAHCNYAN